MFIPLSTNNAYVMSSICEEIKNTSIKTKTPTLKKAILQLKIVVLEVLNTTREKIRVVAHS